MSNDELLAEVIDPDDGGDAEQSDHGEKTLEAYEARQLCTQVLVPCQLVPYLQHNYRCINIVMFER